jgi:hypothetical protein
MIDLTLYICLGFVTVIIAVLGGHVSSGNRKHRLAFYILGAISMILIIFTGYRNYLVQIEGVKSRQQLEKSIGSLKDTTSVIAKMSKEAIRVGDLNAKLQEQLLKQSKTITTLSQKSINNTVGGDSFCYLRIVFPQAIGWTPLFIHIGEYPLYGVKLRIVDLEKFALIKDKLQHMNPVQIFSDDITIELGDMTPHMA